MKLNNIEIKKIGISLYAFLSFAYVMYKFAVENMANFGIFMLIAFVGIYYLISNNIEKKAQCVNDILVWLMSFLFSIATVTGCYFTNGLIFSKMTSTEMFMYLFIIGGLTSVFKCLFVMAYRFFENWAERESNIEKRPIKSKWKTWLFAFVIIMACWLVVWLAYYPGLWNYDPYQVYQVITGEYTKYHPLLHTLLLGWCYVFGIYQDNINLGVTIYAYIQMMIMAGIFAYAYAYIKEHVSSKIFRVLTLLFFAIFPVNSIMVLSTTKDTLFSGFVLMGVILALEYFEKSDKKEKTNKIGIAVLVLFIILMMLYRNNAFYAFLVTLVVSIVLLLFKQDTKKIIIFLLVCIVAYKSCDVGLTNALSASDGPVGEMLSVTSQQFGRIYKLADEIGDDESKQLIENFYRMENAQYQPALSDTMKSQLMNVDSSEGMIEYFKTAWKLFKKYPVISIESFIYLTQGYWDVNDTSHADIYDFYGVTTEYRFGYIMTTVFEGYGITTDSKLPAVEAFYEETFTENSYQNLPIVPLIFAPASYVWFLLFCTIAVIKKKDWNVLILYSFLWGYMLTLFLGPCVLIRYVYLLVVSLPVLIYTLLNTISKKKLEETNG